MNFSTYNKNQLLDLLEQKTKQLENAKKENSSWKRLKHLKTSNTEISDIYVDSLENEVKEIEKALSDKQ